MNTPLPLHLIDGSPENSGEILILGQNILLPTQAGLPPQYAAAIYVTRAWTSEAPAAGLVIKTAFARPMLPNIRPGNMIWEQVVAPHFGRLLGIVSQVALNPMGPRLGGVVDQVSNLVRRQSAAFLGGGALLLPHIDLPLPTSGSFYRPAAHPLLQSATSTTPAKAEAKPFYWSQPTAQARVA